jgi:hypothetical protein
MATLMMSFATTWLVDALIFYANPPGATAALGIFFVVFAVFAAFMLVSAFPKRALAAVPGVAHPSTAPAQAVTSTPTGKIPGWLPGWDPCWPVAALAACRDEIVGHLHHRGSQASSGCARTLLSGLATPIFAISQASAWLAARTSLSAAAGRGSS